MVLSLMFASPTSLGRRNDAADVTFIKDRLEFSPQFSRSHSFSLDKLSLLSIDMFMLECRIYCCISLKKKHAGERRANRGCAALPSRASPRLAPPFAAASSSFLPSLLEILARSPHSLGVRSLRRDLIKGNIRLIACDMCVCLRDLNSAFLHSITTNEMFFAREIAR